MKVSGWVLLCMMFLCAGCSGGPDPSKDDPPPPQASEMSEEEIKSERALGAKPPE